MSKNGRYICKIDTGSEVPIIPECIDIFRS